MTEWFSEVPKHIGQWYNWCFRSARCISDGTGFELQPQRFNEQFDFILRCQPTCWRYTKDLDSIGIYIFTFEVTLCAFLMISCFKIVWLILQLLQGPGIFSTWCSSWCMTRTSMEKYGEVRSTWKCLLWGMDHCKFRFSLSLAGFKFRTQWCISRNLLLTCLTICIQSCLSYLYE